MRENLHLGDIDAPIIPKLDVLRHAKQEAIDEELSSKKMKDEDEIQAIYRLNFENPYKSSIAAVSYLPFKVCYGTGEQISVYEQYYKMHKNATSISIDATGSVVRKLKRSLETKSAHIFLYVIAIHFDNTSLAVYQLLTESQETETIEHWLRMWLRNVKYHKPTQVVVDYSRAMLLACSKAFNDITIKKYIEICFKAASAGENVSREWISTYVRIDVAHMINLVCRWPSLKTHPLRSVRDFYIRCIALMIDCQNFQDFVEVFSLTCIVALQYHQDSQVSVKLGNKQIKQTAKQSREKLESLIKERPIDIDNYLQINSSNDELNNNIEDIGSDNVTINEFFNSIKIEAQAIIHQGEDTNFFYLPKFIDQLLKIGKEFPLWTAVCVPFYTSHPTTSYCERIFREIKNEVFKNYLLPQRIDNFIKIHLRDLIGGTRSFSAKMQNFVVNEKMVPTWKPKDFREYNIIHPISESVTKPDDTCNVTVFSEHSYSKFFDSDLLSKENWRGKAESLFFNNESQEKIEYNISNNMIESNNGLSGVQLDYFIKDINSNTTFMNCDTDTDKDNLSTSLLNSDLEIKSDPENQIFQAKIIESEETNFETSIHNIQSQLVNSQNKNKLNVEQQKNTQIETKYFEYKPSHSKFFRAYPEVKINNKVITKHVKRYLLKNASKCGTYKIDGKTYLLRNTCPFDSIAQIIFTSILDNPVYFSIAETSNNPLFNFIFKFINNGPTHKIYIERFILLKSLYEYTKNTTKSEHCEIIHSYDATDSPAEVWTKLLESLPSIYHTEQCNNCGEHEIMQSTLMPNHNIIIKEGFSALERALKFYPKLHNKRCNRCDTNCTQVTEANCHVFIELDIKASLQSASKKCKLGDLPTMIKLGKHYRYINIGFL